MFKHALRRATVLGATVALTGCQTYEPRPLDLPRHAAEWADRRPDSTAVRDFAQRLAETGAGGSATFDPHDGLSVDEATLVALTFNPALRIARLEAGVTRAGAAHSERGDDPEATFNTQRIVEDVPEPWIVTTGLSITFPISGSLAAERDRTESAVVAEWRRVSEHEWTVRGALRSSWLDWSGNRLEAEATRVLVSQLESVVGTMVRLAEAGEITSLEAGLFTIELASTRVELERLDGEAIELNLALREQMGLAPDAPVTFVPSLVIAEPPNDAGDPYHRTNPTLRRLEAEYEVAERTLVREIRKQYPDLTIGPTYQSEDGQSRVGFAGGIPLPVINGNARGVAEARARREVARAAYETAYERVAGRLARAEARLENVQERRRTLEQNVIPLIDRQTSDARRLLAIGEGRGLVLLESLLRAHRTKLQLLRLRLDEAAAQNDIVQHLGPRPGTPQTLPLDPATETMP